MAAKSEHRRLEILNMLNTEETVYVTETAELFHVTTETIRADFDFLAAKYRFCRVHGGLKRDENELYHQPYVYQINKTINIEAKKRISYSAADLVDDGDCLYLDGGSTVYFLLNFIAEKKRLTVVTSSIAVLFKYITDGVDKLFLKNGNKLIFTGGYVNTDIFMTYGSFFYKTIQDFHFDKMFLSVDAVDLKGGCTNADEIAYAVARQVSDRVRQKIILVDSSKFGQIANYIVLSWDRVDIVVSEKDPGEVWLKHFADYRIRFVQA